MNNPLYISSEMKLILAQMKEQSNLAKILLDEDIDIDILADDYVNYISVSTVDVSKISYLPKDRVESDIDLWSSKKRIYAKPGTFLRKVFKNITDREVEIFSTIYRNIQLTKGIDFQIVEGEDIRMWYLHENYLNQSSSLGNSCMKYESCQKYMDIYTKNNSNIKMLCVFNDGLLVGRALLWYGVVDNSTTYNILDRVYTINDEEYMYHFKKWADDNGFFYKKEQKWNNTLFFVSNGVDKIIRGSIKLSNTDFKTYPYLDTFKFLDKKNNTVYNYIPIDNDNIITISGAEGSPQSFDFLKEDGLTNLFWYSSDMVYVGYKNIWTHKVEVVKSKIYDTYILKTETVYNNDISDWIYLDDSLNNWDEINTRINILNEQKEKIKKKITWERLNLYFDTFESSIWG